MLLKQLVFELKESYAYMTLVYDETAATQKVIRWMFMWGYWDSVIGGIETLHHFFAQAKSEDLDELMTEKLLEIESLPWEKVFQHILKWTKCKFKKCMSC